MDWPNAIGRRGYAIIPALFSSDEIAALADSMTQVPRGRSRAGARHLLAHSSIATFAASARLLAIAQRVLGRDAFPFRATLFEKSQAANWLVVWHQDTALPLRERKEVLGWGPWSVKDGVTYAHAPATALSRVLALRLHLDDSTALNGPLRVLPGTHTLGVLEDEAIHALAAKVKPVECEVSRGGVLAMRPLLVHASSKSQSGAPRRVLHIEYAEWRETADGMELAVA
jgi:ectoine hydroxylase-related dioxygenase (phytanoyl-CoA dioxygenase family)